jgi:hypothetical protein
MQNTILKAYFDTGKVRYYPYEISNRLIVSIYQSFVLFHLENEPDYICTPIVKNGAGFDCFEFDNVLMPLNYSIKY